MIFYVVRIQGTLFCESDTVTPWKLAEICGAWNHDSDYPASHACRGSCRQLRGFYTSLYLLTAVGFPPGFSSTVHIYIQTTQRTLIFLYFQLDTLFFRLRTISAILFPLHVSGLTGPSSGGLNCTCSLWYSLPLQMSLSCGRWERTFSTAARQRHLQRGRIP